MIPDRQHTHNLQRGGAACLGGSRERTDHPQIIGIVTWETRSVGSLGCQGEQP